MALGVTAIYILLAFLSVSDTFPGLQPYRIQLILGIVAVTLTGAGLLIRGGIRIQKQEILMACFTATVVCSWLPHGWLGGAVAALQSFMPLSIVFFLTAWNVRSLRSLKFLRLCVLGLTVYLTARGLMDYFVNPESSKFVLIQNDQTVILARLQAQGFLADPNAYAQFLLTMLPLLFLGFRERSALVRFFVIFPAAALFLTAIYCTHSRGGLIGLVVLIGVTLWRRTRLATGGVAAAAIAVALIAVGYSGGRAISVTGGMDRLAIWSDGLGLFKHSPIWGIGYNEFQNRLIYTAHNSFLLCATELGLIGLFFWMALLLTSGWSLNAITAAPCSDPELKTWADAILLSMIAFLVPGFFLSETYAAILYLLLGMAAGVTRLAVEGASEGEAIFFISRWPLKTAIACACSLFLVYAMVRLRAV